jgi:FAD/FMN-containing dehydrogenase
MRKSRSTPSLDELEQAIDGDVVVPGSPTHGRLPKTFNARFDDVVPQAVVLCRSAEDVAETISFVRLHQLESATRSGGHCFAGRSSTPGILIDVTPMSSISVSDGVARVGAGSRLGEVYLGMLAHDLTIPGGTCPSVGVAGLTLGGGLGILGRTYGVTSDRLLGARIVIADGRILECDEHHEADLFWALRGAGTGNFGVVTDLVFRPVPIPAATSFHLTWSFSHAAAVAKAWLDWAPIAPDELAASLVMAAGGDPDEPPSVEVFGTILDTRSDAVQQLDELTGPVSADPTSTFVEEMSYRDTLRYWADRAGELLEDPHAQVATRGYHVIKSEFFTRLLPAEAIASLLDHLARGRAVGQSRELDFSPWGGAYNRMRADATAFVHRDPLFSLKHAVDLGVDTTATERADAHAWVARSWESVRRWGSGRVFPNFSDPDLEDWGNAYYGSNYERLLEVKARYDSENLFRFRQSLPVR